MDIYKQLKKTFDKYVTIQDWTNMETDMNDLKLKYRQTIRLTDYLTS